MKARTDKIIQLFALLVAFFCFGCPVAASAYQDISPDSLSKWIKSSSSPYLLDVREQDEYVARYIAGAVLFPYNSGVLQKRYGKLPSSGPIVVICKAGSRSDLAAKFLEGLAGAPFKDRVFRLQGGMDAWKGPAVLNDIAGVARKKVLFEMFTASWCSYCYASNKYLDESFIDEGLPIAMIRYHYADVGFVTPQDRVTFLYPKGSSVGVPDLFIDGAKEIYPDYVTYNMVSEAGNVPASLTIALLGNKPGAADSGVLKVELTGSATVSLDSLNLFVVLTESGIDPMKWNPPYTPPNGETIFDNAMREMVTGQSGLRFAVQPGEKIEIQAKYALKSDWKADNCELVVFVQDMKTKKVQQAIVAKLSELEWEEPPANRKPAVSLPGGQSYRMFENDTLRLTANISDPDSAESLVVWFYYSFNGVLYSIMLPPHVTFRNPVFQFAPDTSQAGLYRFMLRVVDHAGAHDSLRFTVEVQNLTIEPVRRCDCNQDGHITIRDIIAFMLLLRNDPASKALDWNGDGARDFSDVLAFARDLTAGRCPDAALANVTALAGGTEGALTISGEEAAWVEAALAEIKFDSYLESDLRAELAAVTGTAGLPRSFSLSQNSPNPFNPSTVIAFDIPAGSEGMVSLKVFDLRGRVLDTLVDGLLQPGRHTVFWDGRDRNGRELSSGVYLYRLSTPGWSQTRKMVLLK
jgi:rhodanese-related sulfurtransferase